MNAPSSTRTVAQRAEMGCYGIGVTRILGAAIEQNNDARSIICRRRSRPSRWSCARFGWSKSKPCRKSEPDLRSALLHAGVDVISTIATNAPGDVCRLGTHRRAHRVTIGDRGLGRRCRIPGAPGCRGRQAPADRATIIDRLKGRR